MEEIWKKVSEFPHYAVSTDGRIRNEIFQRLVKISRTKQGALKVGFTEEGTQYTRSVKVVVAEAFIFGKSEAFDTPIQLDGNQENCRAENIVWRPRWFAWKYHRQFTQLDRYSGVGPITDTKTGMVYKDIVECALINGLLFEEVYISLVQCTSVFPTWQVFDWVE